MEKKPHGILMILARTIVSFHAQLDLFPLFFFLASHFSIFVASQSKDDFLKQKHDQQSNATHNTMFVLCITNILSFLAIPN